jgi:hypothetical protein
MLLAYSMQVQAAERTSLEYPSALITNKRLEEARALAAASVAEARNLHA